MGPGCQLLLRRRQLLHLPKHGAHSVGERCLSALGEHEETIEDLLLVRYEADEREKHGYILKAVCKSSRSLRRHADPNLNFDPVRERFEVVRLGTFLLLREDLMRNSHPNSAEP